MPRRSSHGCRQRWTLAAAWIEDLWQLHGSFLVAAFSAVANGLCSKIFGIDVFGGSIEPMIELLSERCGTPDRSAVD